MENQPETEAKSLANLGLIAAIFKEYKIIGKIDNLLPKISNNQTLTHGEAVFTMVLQGLGFSNNRLYLSNEFLSHVEIQELFGREISLEHFNATVLSRTLDAIYEYGATRFYTDTCLGVVLSNIKKFIHIDTTSMYVTGRKYKNKEGIKLTHGYSKDYRADLKQLIYLLVSSEDGLPLMHEVHSGNEADNVLFQNSILNVQELVKNDIDDKVLVCDASLYNKEFLRNKDVSCNWVTRVPESVMLCKNTLSKEREDWIKLDNDYKYAEITVKYGGVEQRWIIVRNRESKYKELDSLKKRLKNEEESIEKSHKKLPHKVFLSKVEANIYIANQKDNHPLFNFNHAIVSVYKKVPKTKHKVKIGVKIIPRFSRNDVAIKKLENRKGKFILATNCLDDKTLPAKEIIAAYRGRNKAVEGSFKFLKDRSKNLNQIFLKKESRIEALLGIMTIILMVNNLAQLKLREFLVETNCTVPSQTGRSSQKPTFKWVSYLLRHVIKLKIKNGNAIYAEVKGVKKEYEVIIRAFGDYAAEIYGLA